MDVQNQDGESIDEIVSTENQLIKKEKIDEIAKSSIAEPETDEIKLFISIKQLNWGWKFKSTKGKWKLFDCIICMLLESKWQQYLKGGKCKIIIRLGEVDFNQMIALRNDENGLVHTLMIERTSTNRRDRPDGAKRHQDSSYSSFDPNKLNLINKKDLEWLAWNWQSWLNQQLFTSRKHMIFEMFNRNYPFLPSIEQILYGIILAQID